jgi:hypothetical protein
MRAYTICSLTEIATIQEHCKHAARFLPMARTWSRWNNIGEAGRRNAVERRCRAHHRDRRSTGVERHETPSRHPVSVTGPGVMWAKAARDPHSLHSEKSKFDDTALVVPWITSILGFFRLSFGRLGSWRLHCCSMMGTMQHAVTASVFKVPPLVVPGHPATLASATASPVTNPCDSVPFFP